MNRNVPKIWSQDQEIAARSALANLQKKINRYSTVQALESYRTEEFIDDAQRKSCRNADPVDGAEWRNICFIEDVHLELQRLAFSIGGDEALRVISKTDWLAAVVRDTARAFDLLARRAESLRQIEDSAKDSGGDNHE